MGIIGIVSALTLPNLNSSTGEKEKVAKVKKLHQNLDDAIGRATAVYGPVEEWKTLDSEETAQQTRFGDRLTEFMKVSKNCGMTANQGCFAKTTKILKGSNYSYNDSSSVYKFILADGSSVLITSGGGILVDIDGPNKGKNTWGIDLFAFVKGDDNTSYVPMGHSTNISGFISELKPTCTGIIAAGWVIRYDNMDYLKLTSEGKCPNGTTPTEENPRCK